MKLNSLFLLALASPHAVSAFSVPSSPQKASTTSTTLNLDASNSIASRRQFFQAPAAFAIMGTLAASTAAPLPANAENKIATSLDGNLPDLPTEATRSYLQYRVPLAIASDYYVFDLQSKLTQIDDWGDINQLFQVNNNRGQGQPSKIERDYVNPMRILSLSMPPDEAEDMRVAQYKFEKAMNKISKAVSGVRRDLPVEIDPNAVGNAQKGWEEGRVALNEFYTILASTTGLNELKLIPAAGENQIKEYGRSPRRYNELMKKTKLCQNRGGPALSQAWGQLMVSGYLQDSCGIPDLEAYFLQ